MQTHLADFIKNTPDGDEAEAILRSCVHCGFCTATCPTYQLLGDERDGPRGRIYLIKQVLEGEAFGAATQTHLDRCLTCRSCETTCPSGVQYGRLVDIGRGVLEEKLTRPLRERVLRRLLRLILPFPARVEPLVAMAQALRPLLPRTLKRKIPERQVVVPLPVAQHARKMLILDGCVQPSLAPNINAATARVLDRLGISIIPAQGAGCCGALSYHLSARDEAKGFIRRNIDAWWPHIEQGAEAIVMTASGCGAMVKDYGHVLRDDPAYAAKAAKVSELTRDIGEVLIGENAAERLPRAAGNIAFHCPCTLQHGQKFAGQVERLLTDLGFTLGEVENPHLCCGSAGTYSILQPELSQRLLVDKMAALERSDPAAIATANIGCLVHLQSATDKPVRHWVEIVEEGMRSTC